MKTPSTMERTDAARQSIINELDDEDDDLYTPAEFKATASSGRQTTDE